MLADDEIRVPGGPFMTWSNAYLGLPWARSGSSREGCTCWGLVRLVYAERCGIDLPDYAGMLADIANAEAVGAIFDSEKRIFPWRPVDLGSIRPFDLLVFRRAGQDRHVGIATGVPSHMLHITSSEDSRLADFGKPPWASRLSGAYRHHAIADHAD